MKVQNLNRTLGDLEEGTKSRNRTFQKQIVREQSHNTWCSIKMLCFSIIMGYFYQQDSLSTLKED
jgi:hypothetical protein